MCFALVKWFVSLLGDDHDLIDSAEADPRSTLPTVLRVSGPTQGNHEDLPLRGRGWIPGRRGVYRLGEVPARRGVRLQEGWIHALAHLRPASAGMTDGEGEGVGGLL